LLGRPRSLPAALGTVPSRPGPPTDTRSPPSVSRFSRPQDPPACRLLYAEAGRVEIDAFDVIRQGDTIRSFQIAVRSHTRENALFDVKVRIEGLPDFPLVRQVDPGRTAIGQAIGGIGMHHPDSPWENVPVADEGRFYDEQVAKVTVTFTMATKQWR